MPSSSMPRLIFIAGLPGSLAGEALDAVLSVRSHRSHAALGRLRPPQSEDQQDQPAAEGQRPDEGLQRDRLLLLGGYLHGPHIDDLLAGGVREALVGQRQTANYQEDDAKQHDGFHARPPSSALRGISLRRVLDVATE